MRGCRFLFMSLALLAGSVVSASAATVAEVQGTVLVNTGQGFRPAVAGQELPAGAKVMINAGGRARISYPNFCVATLSPGQVYTVPQQAPCGAGSPYIPGELLPHDYAIGGAVAVAVGVAVILNDSGSSKKPASP